MVGMVRSTILVVSINVLHLVMDHMDLVVQGSGDHLNLTGGGGGGGASRTTYYRGSNGAIAGQRVYWTIGQGGTQGGNGSRRRGDNGAMYISQTTYDALLLA